MKRHLAFAAAMAFALTTPTASSAQGALPAFEIRTILRSAGLDPIGRIERRGGEFVLRAIDTDGTHVRVIVDARDGHILAVAPIVSGGPGLPPGPVARRYDPEEAPGYIAPDTRRVFRGPPDVYEDDIPPRIYRRGSDMDDDGRAVIEGRSLPPVPHGPPPVIAATPDGYDRSTTQSVPRHARPQQPGEAGLLPPPPERFPQRLAPAASKPAPAVRRTAALPKQPPLPRPRPSASADAPAQAVPAKPPEASRSPEAKPTPEAKQLMH